MHGSPNSQLSITLKDGCPPVFTAFKTDEDFNPSIEVLNAFVAESEEYSAFIAGRFNLLEKKMSVFADYVPAKNALSLHKEKLSAHNRQLEPLISAHIENGKRSLQSLELLKTTIQGIAGFTHSRLTLSSCSCHWL